MDGGSGLGYPFRFTLHRGWASCTWQCFDFVRFVAFDVPGKSWEKSLCKYLNDLFRHVSTRVWVFQLSLCITTLTSFASVLVYKSAGTIEKIWFEESNLHFITGQMVSI